MGEISIVLQSLKFYRASSGAGARHAPQQDRYGAADQQGERDRDAADPANGELQRARPGVHAERMQQPRQQQRAHQPMHARGRHAGHFEHGDHQRDDGDVFRKVGMRADRAAELCIVAVAETRLVFWRNRPTWTASTA